MRVNPRLRTLKSIYKTYIDIIHVSRDEQSKLFSVKTDSQSQSQSYLESSQQPHSTVSQEPLFQAGCAQCSWQGLPLALLIQANLPTTSAKEHWKPAAGSLHSSHPSKPSHQPMTALACQQNSLSPEWPPISCCLHPTLQGPHNSCPLVPAAGQRLPRRLGGQGGRDAGEPARQAMTCSALRLRSHLHLVWTSPHVAQACHTQHALPSHLEASIVLLLSDQAMAALSSLVPPVLVLCCQSTALGCFNLNAVCQVPALAPALLSQNAVCQTSTGSGMAQNTGSVSRIA